jgi:hypothetical protein
MLRMVCMFLTNDKKEVKSVKLIEEIFEMYRGRIRGTEQDLDLIALTILEETSREDLLELIHELSTEELQYFFRLYIFETLKEKWSGEEIELSAYQNREFH